MRFEGMHAAIGLVLLAGCESGAPPGEEPAPAAPAPASQPAAAEPKSAPPGQDCVYDYAVENTKLTWTAFKLTERVGVSGTFKGLKVDGTVTAKEAAKVFEAMTFEIDTGSVDSANPDRDKKLVASFFGTLAEGGTIKGAVKGLEAGKGTVELTLGGVTKPVELAYALGDDSVLKATGKIDLGDFNGTDAVAALNKVCEALHTGEDKKSKLWPDVELSIESKLNKSCE